MPRRNTTLADILRDAGLTPAETIVHRIALDPADGDEGYRSTADLARTGHTLIYERIQDGAVFGQEALVAGFVAMADGTALFAGLRTLVARRPGVAPGDIIYDPEIAHLLHNFIARARQPVFYDAFADERGNALDGVALRWPPAGPDMSHPDIRSGDDPSLILIEAQP